MQSKEQSSTKIGIESICPFSPIRILSNASPLPTNVHYWPKQNTQDRFQILLNPRTNVSKKTSKSIYSGSIAQLKSISNILSQPQYWAVALRQEHYNRDGDILLWLSLILHFLCRSVMKTAAFWGELTEFIHSSWPTTYLRYKVLSFINPQYAVCQFSTL